MKRAIATISTCATLLWSATVLAITHTPQQNCDYARITAWKTYQSCVDAVVAKDAKVVPTDQVKAFWKCRHAYFKKWAGFQTKASLAGSTCIGSRFTDDDDQTVTDNLSGLVWEKKDHLNGVADSSNPHDADNVYWWSASGTAADGGAFQNFLPALNAPTCFAGQCDWRLPTIAELQTIMADFACIGVGNGPTCRCQAVPCIDPALDAANTRSSYYWSATSHVWGPASAWDVYFGAGEVDQGYKQDQHAGGTIYARAVRGGW